MHLACLAVLVVGWSPVALAVAAALFLVRMFAITAFYHRYFSHRAFRASRPVQFLMAVLGSSAVQRGPLWWAAHHRKHHRHSDEREDVHSPVQHGLLWSHVGWFTTRGNHATDLSVVPDLARFRELRLLDRFDTLVPVALAALLYATGAWLQGAAPELGTSGPQLLVWGFFVSTVCLFHGTFTINSLAHRFGTRRYETPDDSRNNVWLALLTLGEGWHNNHHYYPYSARQGFRWWELDLSYWALRALSALGVISHLRPVPADVIAAGARNEQTDAAHDAHR
jgi:stearoyl-CoA desaturase (delta-9 desaturase)